MSEKHKCVGKVRGGGPWPRYYDCARNAKFERGDKWYCGIHDPEKVMARHEKNMAAYRAKSEKESKVRQMERAAPALYEALRALTFAAQTTGGTAGRDEGLCAAIDKATAALAKARGGS